MVNPNRITGWQVIVLILASVLLCCSVGGDPGDQVDGGFTVEAAR